LGEPVGVGLERRDLVDVCAAVADARDAQRPFPESPAPFLAVASPVSAMWFASAPARSPAWASTCVESVTCLDLLVLELFARLVGGQSGVRDQREQVGAGSRPPLLGRRAGCAL